MSIRSRFCTVALLMILAWSAAPTAVPAQTAPPTAPPKASSAEKPPESPPVNLVAEPVEAKPPAAAVTAEPPQAPLPLPPGSADPSGSYDISGNIPTDNSTYAGTVTVARTGDTFAITWTIEDESVTGIGILTGSLLSVGFTDEGKDSVAVFEHRPDGSWIGRWAAVTDTTISTETWQPRR